MRTITVRNVNEALPHGIDLLAQSGYPRPSRNGEVLVHDGPVTTLYLKPKERVLFWPEREANPFFHLFEAVYMLTGRNSVYPLEWIVKRMGDFSDNGFTFHGFYGHRWRNAFAVDQLEVIANRLKYDPDDRRIVLQMWDVRLDLGSASKDAPCNTAAYFAINVHGELDLTVTNRSNDIIWGAYGANAVHMSFLQEYMAEKIGVPTGRYWQVSNNYHAYTKTLDPLLEADRGSIDLLNPYVEMRPLSIVHPGEDGVKQFEHDLEIVADVHPKDWEFKDMLDRMESFFISTTLLPMMLAYQAYKARDFDEALRLCRMITAPDWGLACTEWIQRRKEKHDALHQGS